MVSKIAVISPETENVLMLTPAIALGSFAFRGKLRSGAVLECVVHFLSLFRHLACKVFFSTDCNKDVMKPY